ncbi:MAG: phosphatase PAP2 family protein [Rhodospirillales bacterium]|nr:phosphatase PAP2 family protein [Rhodospirillales bacterium]
MLSTADMDSLTARFRAVDLVHLAMLGLLVAASLFVWNDAMHAGWLLGLNAVLFAAVAGLAAGPFTRLDPPKAALARLAVSYFLVAALFNELAALVPALNPLRYDGQLRGFDADILLFDPAHSLAFLHHPLLSDFFAAGYFSFYVLPFAFFAVLYRQGLVEPLAAANAAIVTGFYVSFLGNALVPAASPFRTPGLFEAELAGLWLHEPLHYLVAQYEAHELSAFPSGHILVAAIIVLLAARWCPRQAPVFLLWGLWLLLGTLYLGYHYLVDALAALALAPLCAWSGTRLSLRLDWARGTA